MMKNIFLKRVPALLLALFRARLIPGRYPKKEKANESKA